MTLNDLVISLKNYLGEYDPKIKEVQIIYGPNRIGDIPHSMASIEKAQKLLNYQPLALHRKKEELSRGKYDCVVVTPQSYFPVSCCS